MERVRFFQNAFLGCNGKDLLSKIDREKYKTTKSKLIPHALWTEPLGSGAHDANILCKIPFFDTVGLSTSMLATALLL